MTSFRMFEIILYSMVSLLPYLGLALYLSRTSLECPKLS